MRLRILTVIGALSASLVVAYANSGTLPTAPSPPIKRTGAAIDGGSTCAVCHVTYAPANSDPRGRVIVQAKPYVPGAKQIIHVRVQHPEGKRWGFQLTARLASDDSKMAGSFSVTPTVQVRCDDGQLRGAPAPCESNQLQFASHNGTSTQQNSPSGVWDVEWTAPGPDAGDVIFYAAGNAADNSGTNSGDRIYTTSQKISTCNLGGKPTINSIANGASFVPGCSRNSMITIFGANFLNQTQQKEAGINDFDDLSFPTELGCIAVEIAGVRAPITFANQQQINAQVPIDTVGPVEVRVIANVGRPNEIRGDPANITVTKYSPGFFMFGSTKNIAAVTVVNGAAVYISRQIIAPGISRPAKPGEIVSLYGTGFGPAAGSPAAGALTPDVASLTDPITVTIGGTILAASDILYAGLAPGAITGLYQINVRIPASVPDGDAPVIVDVGGVKSQSDAFLPILR